MFILEANKKWNGIGYKTGDEGWRNEIEYIWLHMVKSSQKKQPTQLILFFLIF